jgi:lysozyme family protein
MANYKNIIPFFRKKEGGLSKAITDAARAHPVPDGSGYHTNKGITWQTWSSVFGTDADSVKRFYAMSDADWETIYKKYYWDSIMGDQINSQRIADTMVNWVWGSGQYWPVSNLQKILGINADGSFGNQTLQAVNSADESSLYNELKTTSFNWFTQLGNQPAYAANKAGWLNRLNSLASYVEKGVSETVASATKGVEETGSSIVKIAKSNPIPTAIITALTLISIYAILKSLNKK